MEEKRSNLKKIIIISGAVAAAVTIAIYTFYKLFQKYFSITFDTDSGLGDYDDDITFENDPDDDDVIPEGPGDEKDSDVADSKDKSSSKK